MKTTIYLTILTLYLMVTSTVTAGEIYFKVDIEGLRKQKIDLDLLPCGGIGMENKSLYINTGEFNKISLKTDTLNRGWIRLTEILRKEFGETIGNSDIYFFAAPNDTIVIKGKLNEFKINYTISGNILSEQLLEYNKETRLFKEELNKKRDDYQKAKMENHPLDTIILKRQAYFKCSKKEFLQRKEFVDNHTDYEISALLLTDSHYLTKDDFVKYKNILSESTLKSTLGQVFLNLGDNIEKSKLPEVNDFAPNFSFISAKGDSLNLSDFRGKYVVLDFWGSWCYACLMGVPEMKEIQERYSEKLEIIGVACNDTEKKWLKSIKKYNLTWTNTLSFHKKYNDGNKTFGKNIKEVYGIRSFPTKIIIGKDGKVIGVTEGEGEYFYMQLEEILESD